MRHLAPLGLLLAASTAAAQLNLAQPDNPDVAFASLRLHAPAALTVRDYDLRTRTAKHTFNLVALNRNGLAGRQFDTQTRRWTDWITLGNPTGVPAQYVGADGGREGFDLGLPLINEGGRLRAAFLSQTAMLDAVVGLPAFTLTPNVLDYDSAHNPETTVTAPLALPGTWFSPRSGVREASGGVQCSHFFGTGYPSGEPTTGALTFTAGFLVEASQCGAGAWRFFPHGTPLAGGEVALGPSAVVAHYPEYRRGTPGHFTYDGPPETLIAVSHAAMRVNGRTTYDGVAVRSRNPDLAPGSGTWTHLGAPAGFRIYGTPMLLGRTTDLPINGGLGEVSLLAVGENNGDFRLFERTRTGFGPWTAWRDHGRPADLAAGTPFRMTSGVVWFSGPEARATQRSNVFGYSEPSQGGAKLLHFWAENQRWAFGTSDPAPGDQGLWTQASAALDLVNYDRISVFVRLANGRIYERFYQIDAGWTDGWQWLNLTNNASPFINRGGPAFGG